jgi:hypothetical protein
MQPACSLVHAVVKRMSVIGSSRRDEHAVAAVVRTLLGPARVNAMVPGGSAGPAAFPARRICWMTLVYRSVVKRGHVHVIGTRICNEGPSGPTQPGCSLRWGAALSSPRWKRLPAYQGPYAFYDMQPASFRSVTRSVTPADSMPPAAGDLATCTDCCPNPQAPFPGGVSAPHQTHSAAAVAAVAVVSSI